MNLYLGSRNHPRIKLKIFLSSWVEMDCLIDTGFSGGVTLPQKFKVHFKEKPIMYQKFELADGSKKLYPIYKLRVKFNDINKVVNLSFTESNESFVGIEFLLGFKFVLDLKKFALFLN